MKANTIIWILLVALSATSFSIAGGSATVAILIAAGVKSTLVGWQFMELYAAHPIWRAALATFLVGLLAIIYLLGLP